MTTHNRPHPDEPCYPFAADLSALVDGEVDETVARRLLVHLEICDPCQNFFNAMRQMARAHRDVANLAVNVVDAVLDRDGVFGSEDGDDVLAGDAMVSEGRRRLAQRILGRKAFRRFAAVLYRVAKGYLLMAVDENYRTEVFRQPVAVDAAAVRGRGLVQRILERGEGRYAGYDWVEAGRFLEFNLKSESDLRARARVLLEEALRLKPNFAEARLYYGFFFKLQGELQRAAVEFQKVFETARSAENRGHAGAQLVTIHEALGNYDSALEVIERLLSRRLPEKDARFYFTYFNLAVIRAHRGEFSLATDALATLARRFPERLSEVRSKLATCAPLRQAMECQPEFRAELERRLPALLASTN